MGEEIAKVVWKHRLGLLIGAFAGSLTGLDLSNYSVIYIIAFGVILGLVDALNKKSFSEVNEQKGCTIIFILIMLMIILW
tara:strand:- start:254 stop:493 length:240 start_codon:yes stop_codon:yes gene_type:complete